MSDKVKKNYDLYRELQIPFESPEAAQVSMKAFVDELYDLRAKHRVMELFCVISIPIKFEDGEGHSNTCFYFGSSNNQEALAAFGYGFAQAERQNAIANATADAVKKVKR